MPAPGQPRGKHGELTLAASDSEVSKPLFTLLSHTAGKQPQDVNTAIDNYKDAADLGKIDPAHAAYYKANAASFTASLAAWNKAMATFKSAHPGTPVATTEPVADYMLQAAGTDNLTPFTFQADIMNGTDPSPQNTATERSLFTQHKVKVFLYNQQVTDSLTESYIKLADENGIPVVGVYETMPTPGYTYQSWMLAEVNALNKAVTSKVSTEKL